MQEGQGDSSLVRMLASPLFWRFSASKAFQWRRAWWSVGMEVRVHIARSMLAFMCYEMLSKILLNAS